MSSPKMDIVWDVLPRALDNEDWTVIEACRRLIVANRLGWRRFTNASDWNIVLAFNESPADELAEAFHENDSADHERETC